MSLSASPFFHWPEHDLENADLCNSGLNGIFFFKHPDSVDILTYFLAFVSTDKILI